MADDDLDDDLDDDEIDDDEDGDEESSGGGKKKILIIVVALLLLIVGGAAAAYFTGALDGLLGSGEEKAEEVEEGAEAPPGEAVFYDLQEQLVNLNTGGRKATMLKIRVSLELRSAEDIPKIEALMPRINDSFQVYLRELRVEDLKGSAGMYRLREELLTRVNEAAAPAKINDVLLKEMLVQ